MSLRLQAIRGVFWSAVQNWGSNLISTVVLLLLARVLGPEPFGLVAYATVFIALLAILQQQGTAQALIQRENLEPGHINAAFWISAATGVVLTVALMFVAGLIATAVSMPTLGPVLGILALTLLIDALGTTSQAILRREMLFRSLAVRAIVSATAGGIVGVTMALQGYGVWALVVQRIVASAASTITLWVACRWRPSLGVARRHVRDLLSFGMFIMGNEGLRVMNTQAAPLMIGTFLGEAALGYYKIGYQLLQTMSQLFTATVAAVILPTFSRLQQRREQMRSAFLTATRMTSLLVFPAFLGAAALAPEFVRTVMGEKWTPSIIIMQILAAAGILQSVNYFNPAVIVACGKPSKAFFLALLNAVTNLAVLSITVHWNITIVAIGFVLRGYLLAPLPVYVLGRLLGLEARAYLRQFLSPLAASCAMAAAVWAIKFAARPLLPPIALLGLSIGGGVIVYWLLLKWWAPSQLSQLIEIVRAVVPERTAVEDEP